MKLHSQMAEVQAIKTICGENSRFAHFLMSALNKHHFHHPESREAFQRIQSQARQHGEFPDYSELVIDPALSEDTRSFLDKLGKRIPEAASKGRVKRLRDRLSDYHKLRVIYAACTNTLENLKGESVDVDATIDGLGEQLAKARHVVGVEENLIHIGQGDNAAKLLKRILKGKTHTLIPTGFKHFDERNGGIREGSLFVLTANTGGLKSALSKQLAHNFYYNGYSTAYASLEMDEEEVIYRLFSARTGIENIKFLKSILTRGEKIQAWKSYQEMSRYGAKTGKRFTILPVVEADLGIDQILDTLQPFGYKVIFIDYVSLLADADNEQQWKALGYVARKCKMFAKANKCVVVLLAQLSDEDKIRYSQAIGEHANNWWKWRITPEARESGIFTVDQGKARNQDVFSFELSVDWPTLKIQDAIDTVMSGKHNKQLAESGGFNVTKGRKKGRRDDDDSSYNEIGSKKRKGYYEDD